MTGHDAFREFARTADVRVTGPEPTPAVRSATRGGVLFVVLAIVGGAVVGVGAGLLTWLLW